MNTDPENTYYVHINTSEFKSANLPLVGATALKAICSWAIFFAHKSNQAVVECLLAEAYLRVKG
jgi:hypothetical protein